MKSIQLNHVCHFLNKIFTFIFLQIVYINLAQACEKSNFTIKFKPLLSFASSLFYFYDDVIFHGNRIHRDLYLTFDDGPSLKFTPKLLAILDKYNVKASFFVVGNRLILEKEKELLVQIRAKGHEVYPHSLEHKKNIYFKKPKELLKEIIDLNNTIDQILVGDFQKRNYFRPPWGVVSSKQIEKLNEAGIKVLLADVYGSYLKIPSMQYREASESMIPYIMDEATNGSIVVLHNGEKRQEHDRYFDSDCVSEIIESVLPKLLQRGFQFRLLSELNLLDHPN